MGGDRPFSSPHDWQRRGDGGHVDRRAPRRAGRRARCRRCARRSSHPPVGPKRSAWMRARLVAGVDEQVGDALDEGRRAADEDQRPRRGAGADLGQHRGVDAPLPAGPAGRRACACTSRRRAARRAARAVELVAVEQVVLARARTRAGAPRRRSPARAAVAQHRHQRHEARAAADEQQRAAVARPPSVKCPPIGPRSSNWSPAPHLARRGRARPRRRRSRSTVSSSVAASGAEAIE